MKYSSEEAEAEVLEPEGMREAVRTVVFSTNRREAGTAHGHLDK